MHSNSLPKVQISLKYAEDNLVLTFYIDSIAGMECVNSPDLCDHKYKAQIIKNLAYNLFDDNGGYKLWFYYYCKSFIWVQTMMSVTLIVKSTFSCAGI